MKAGFLIGTLAVLSISNIGFACEDSASAAQDLLRRHFAEAKYWPKSPDNAQQIEFCGGDWCQEVSFTSPDASEGAWKALYVMFYYFEPIPEFEDKGGALASSILEDVGGGACAQVDARAKAACVLEILQREHGLSFRRVQYDVGSRCWSEFQTIEPYFSGVGDCVDAEDD